MKSDMCVPCDEGLLNIRVGAIIMKDGRILMAGNDRDDYLYSVGGRIKFGETAEEAVVRETLEETGCLMEVDRLGFVHENYFTCDVKQRKGVPVYEICFYFYMKVPEDFSPVSDSYTEAGDKEFLEWITLEEERTIFPDFFRTELRHPAKDIRRFTSDEREKQD